MITHTHLLIFSIGPVQSFIAEARRTVDLYAGSRMLVELARAAAKAIKDDGGALIYPAVDDLSQADVPNKLVAMVTNPTIVANRAQQAAEKFWRELAKQALQELGINVDFNSDGRIVRIIPDDTALKTILERQLINHLESYWATAPYKGDYETSYKLADKAFGVRKQLRNFPQSLEDGFKDSLSGSRSALRLVKDKDARVYWEQMQKRHLRQLQESELLDTLGVMKRFGFEDKRQFPSTSTIASASFAKICTQNGLLQNLNEAIKAFNRQVGGLDFQGADEAIVEDIQRRSGKGYFYQVSDFDRGFEYDGDLLYPEIYASQSLKNRYNISSEGLEKIALITEALSDLYQITRQKKLKPNRPSPYYAVLQMDGDSMGKHISQCDSKEKHQKLSQALDAFTQQARVLVKNHSGHLIYAGGDDILAFFPTDRALAAAAELAKTYQQQFADWDQQNEGKSFPFTASIGIAFAHHLYPLDAVLETAQQAEKRAKRQYGRNALSVTVLRRSGETLEVGGKWAGEPWIDKSAPDTVELVKRLIELLEKEQISSRFPYSVFKDAAIVTGLAQEGQEAVLRQLLKRHSTQELQAEATALLQDWSKWAEIHNEWVLPVIEKKRRPDETDKPIKQGFYELARWFVLAGWLAEGGNE